jgi:hypothetical protein
MRKPLIDFRRPMLTPIGGPDQAGLRRSLGKLLPNPVNGTPELSSLT